MSLFTRSSCLEKLFGHHDIHLFLLCFPEQPSSLSVSVSFFVPPPPPRSLTLIRSKPHRENYCSTVESPACTEAKITKKHSSHICMGEHTHTHTHTHYCFSCSLINIQGHYSLKRKFKLLGYMVIAFFPRAKL